MNIRIARSVSEVPRLSVAGLSTCLSSLVFAVYWSIYHPAYSLWVLMAVCLVAMAGSITCLYALTAEIQAKSSLSRRINGSLVAAALGWVLTLHAMSLLTVQMNFVDARKNLDGRMPAIAMEVSQHLRANPFNLWGSMAKTSSITVSALNPDDLSLFRAAYDAGIRSEEIDRVMSNGLVLRGDKDALVKTLLMLSVSSHTAGSKASRILALATPQVSHQDTEE